MAVCGMSPRPTFGGRNIIITVPVSGIITIKSIIVTCVLVSAERHLEVLLCHMRPSVTVWVRCDHTPAIAARIRPLCGQRAWAWRAAYMASVLENTCRKLNFWQHAVFNTVGRSHTSSKCLIEYYWWTNTCRYHAYFKNPRQAQAAAFFLSKRLTKVRNPKVKRIRLE
jgi:hypothetical protein